jgi:hypothetical protein
LALRQDPTAVAAVETLGIDAQIRGDTAAARRLFDYAQVLSRRDLRSELWEIEYSVSRGNVIAALRHYDIALRTLRPAQDLLFPVLSAAIAQPAIRDALVTTLAGRPAWNTAFIDYAASSGNDPKSAALLFATLQRAGVPIAAGPPALVVNALVAARRFDEAWAYYKVIHPSASRTASRDPDFREGLETPSAFDWQPANDASIATSIQRSQKGGLFDFTVASGVGGLLLRQLQLATPGVYRVDGRSTGVEQVAAARPYWTLTCLDGRELGRVSVTNSSQNGGQFRGRFVVPLDCPIQYFSLIAPPSDAVAGLQGQLAQTSIRLEK